MATRLAGRYLPTDNNDGSGFPMRSIRPLRRSIYWLGVFAIVLQAMLPVARAYGDTIGASDASAFPFGLSEICSALTSASGLADGEPGSGAPATTSGHCVLCNLPSFGGAALEARVVVPEPVTVTTVVYRPVEAAGTIQPCDAGPKPIRAPPA